MKEVFKRCFEVFKKRFVNTRTARFLLDLSFLAGCVFFCCADFILAHTLISIVSSFVIYRGLQSVINITDQIHHEMPNFGKRFTEKREDGSVVVRKGDLNEAILYLYAIEEYMERK